MGWVVARALTARLHLDPAIAWGLSPFGVALFALGLECLHIVTGGGVFSRPWLVRALTGATLAAGLVAYVLHRPAGRTRPNLLPALVVAVGWGVWGSPVWRMVPLLFPGDSPMHSGWSAQLLDGETTPSAAITGHIPNFYPWLFHATQAFVTCLLPVQHSMAALAPLQLISLAGRCWPSTRWVA